MIFEKQYKVVSPEITVRQIKRLLKNIGIQVKEETRSLKNLVYSSRITIINGRIANLDLGANGKGLSLEYALASGYAELMERIQTRMLYDDMLMLPPMATREFLGESFFRHAPDEILRKADWSFFPKIGDENNIHVGRTAYGKMFSLRTGKMEMVPLELMRFMTGSTGACAGNTREEAIVQGICEILERHALQKVFLSERIDLPIISLAAFNGSSVMERLIELARKQGLKFSIKDCSFGMGMPILGLLVWNDTSYQFKIGVATSPEVALSRCFTEIFQGYTDNACLLPKDPVLMVATPEHYRHAKLNGTGHVPSSVFSSKQSGTLGGFDPFFGKDINGDYEVLTKQLLSAGYEIYIQDCSYLGFPSYYIYIPGLSDTYPQLLDFQRRLDECMRRIHCGSARHFPLYNSAYLPSKYPTALYSFAEMLMKKDYVSAKILLKSLLGCQLPKTSYNKAIMEFVCLRADSRRIEFIKKELSRHWGDMIVSKIFEEFGSDADISSTFRMPTCFKCSVCPTKSMCALRDLSKLDAVIRRKYCKFSKSLDAKGRYGFKRRTQP